MGKEGERVNSVIIFASNLSEFYSVSKTKQQGSKAWPTAENTHYIYTTYRTIW